MASCGTASFGTLRLSIEDDRGRTRDECIETVQHLVGGVGDASMGPVHYAYGLDRQLTQLITIGNVRNCLEYQMRTHCYPLLWRSVLDSGLPALPLQDVQPAQFSEENSESWLQGLSLVEPSKINPEENLWLRILSIGGMIVMRLLRNPVTFR